MGLSTEARIAFGNEPGAVDCVFCDVSRRPENEVLISDQTFVAILDKFPVNPGHTLIIPGRHVQSMFDLTPKEWNDLRRSLLAVKGILDERFHPAGYNVGINCGRAAGQTISHLHLHVIPRYEGDVHDPRGGIRNFKPALVPYP